MLWDLFSTLRKGWRVKVYLLQLSKPRGMDFKILPDDFQPCFHLDPFGFGGNSSPQLQIHFSTHLLKDAVVPGAQHPHRSSALAMLFLKHRDSCRPPPPLLRWEKCWAVSIYFSYLTGALYLSRMACRSSILSGGGVWDCMW